MPNRDKLFVHARDDRMWSVKRAEASISPHKQSYGIYPLNSDDGHAFKHRPPRHHNTYMQLL